MSEKQVKKEFLVLEGYETCSGSRIAPIFEEVFDEERQEKIVKQTGEFDIYEQIQMSSNGSEIAMLKRQAKNSGVPIELDPNLVSGQNQALYPSDIHEAMKMSTNVNQAFAKLPSDIQSELFGGDANAYLKAVMDGSINSKIGTYYNTKAQAAQAVAAPSAEGGAE